MFLSLLVDRSRALGGRKAYVSFELKHHRPHSIVAGIGIRNIEIGRAWPVPFAAAPSDADVLGPFCTTPNRLV
jgi:hypothetical protein